MTKGRRFWVDRAWGAGKKDREGAIQVAEIQWALGVDQSRAARGHRPRRGRRADAGCRTRDLAGGTLAATRDRDHAENHAPAENKKDRSSAAEDRAQAGRGGRTAENRAQAGRGGRTAENRAQAGRAGRTVEKNRSHSPGPQ